MPSLKILMAVAECPPHDITSLCSLMQLQLLIVMKMPFIPLVIMQFSCGQIRLSQNGAQERDLHLVFLGTYQD